MTPRPGAPTVEPETTLRDALSTLLGSGVQLGVVVDARQRVIGLVSVEAIGERLREPVRRRWDLRRRRGRGRRLVRPGEPFIRFDWIVDNLDEIAQRLGEHLVMVVAAVVIGFVVSFALAMAARRWRALYGPILAVTGTLYAIPSLALFVLLIPVTGLTLSDRDRRARPLHPAHPHAQHRRRAATACRPKSSRPRPGWATAPASASGASSCRSPCR